MLFRSKKDIDIELPPKTESSVFLEFSDLQQKLYEGLLAEVGKKVATAFKSESPNKASFFALTLLLRLRQLCVSPRLLDAKQKELSPKFLYLQESLKSLLDEGHSALIFSQFTTTLDYIEESCKAENMPYFRMDGKTPIAKRKKIGRAHV